MQAAKTRDPKLLSFVGYSGEHHLIANTEELDLRLSELPSGENRDRSRLFSYTEDLPIPLKQAICLNFRQFDQLDSYPPTLALEENRKPTATFRIIVCDCDRCFQNQSCGTGQILEANFSYYQLCKDSGDQKSETQNSSHLFPRRWFRKSSKAPEDPSSTQKHQFEVFFDKGEIRLGGENLRPVKIQLTSAQLRILKINGPNDSVNMENFHTGPLVLEPRAPHKLVRQESRFPSNSKQTYLLLQLGQICDAWEELLGFYKVELQALNRRILNNSEDLQRDRAIIRKLFECTKIWEEFREVQRLHLKAAKELEGLGGDELGDFFDLVDSRPNGVQVESEPNGVQAGRERKPVSEEVKILERLESIEKMIKEDLVDETRQLVIRTESIISIDEAYNSRDQNASMKRLSWITFIFLPLLFIASLFGMNIDLLANNPSWTYYLYLSVPVFAVIMLGVLFLKYLKPYFSTNLPKNTRKSDIVPPNEEKRSADSTLELFWATENNLGTIVSRLLNEGNSVSARNNRGHTLLQTAAEGGHLAVVECLLQEKADVNAEPAENAGRTALQAAAEGGHLAVVECLLQEKADVNAEPAENAGRTALQAAAEGGHLAVVERLLQEKADVNAAPARNSGRTALQAAAGGGHLAVVERLLQEKADVNAEPAEVSGWTALQAAAGGGHLAVVERLLQEKADVNAARPGDMGRSALQAAAGGGYLAVVERLLQEMADVNAAAATWHGQTALQAAAEGGHLAVVERLLQEKADVNAAPAEYMGRTVLQAAAGGGYLAVVERLLQEKADVNAAPARNSGRTALQAAAGGGHLAVVERLLQEKADVNAEPAEVAGWTPLQAAAGGGHLAVVERLLQEKADVNAAAATRHGQTALQAAAEGGHSDIAACLRRAGARE